jgi:ferredoxin--NADP+ reductase
LITRYNFADAFCPTFARRKRQIMGGTGFGDKSTSLFMSPMWASSRSPERVKQVGGGIPLVPPGDFLVFNPEEEGKLQGTGELLNRIENGPNYAKSPPTQSLATVESKSQIVDAQCWLEDIGLPLNYAKPQSPVIATVMGSARIIGEDATGDIKHIILKLPEGMHYVEGQSISVIPEGIDPATNRPYAPRLYSIASTRYGDLLDGQTVSLCVRRAMYYDPITNLPDPAKKGVCSNFLCDAPKGKEVKVAGPVGKTMLLPEDCTTDIIMIATGTGIAPFRSFLHRLFMENTTANHLFQGFAWLVLGVPTTSGLLYDDEFTAMQKRHGSDKFRLDYAISREMTNNIDGGKLYVQHVIAQNADELFTRLDNGAHVYFCGLKGMMAPILDTLETAAASKNIIWADKLKELKANKQWHVEVY